MLTPVDDIKNKLDIIDVVQGYIRLQKAGRNYRANCPFHSEKTPSFFVSPERQMWHCFGCGTGGSMFDFVMQIEGVEFGDALRILARRAGVELKKIDPKFQTKKTRLYDICELSSRFFEKQLEASKVGQQVREYLIKRGLKSPLMAEWRVGFAPDKWRALSDFLQSRGYSEQEIIEAGLALKGQDQTKSAYDRFRNRIIFPISDLTGLIIGFSGRIYDDSAAKEQAKYINTPGTLLYDKSTVLYGLNKAKMEIRKSDLCILVEGQMDVLAAHQAGFGNVIATSGTALTVQHLKVIRRYTENIAMAFDMDLAGESATKRAVDLVIGSGLSSKIITLPQGQDPADVIVQDVAVWSQAVEKAESIVEYYFSNTLSKFDATAVEGKKNIAKILLPVVKRLPNRIEQAHWLGLMAQKLKTDEKILTEELNKIRLVDAYREEEQKTNDVFLESNDQSYLTAQHVLGLLLAYPKKIALAKKQPSHLFVNKDLHEIFKYMKEYKPKEKFKVKSFQKKLPANLAAHVDYLALKTETIEQKDLDVGQEVEFCFAQLQKSYLQSRLTSLNLAIKEAEGRKDASSLKDLCAKFNKLSQQLSSV